MGKKMRIKQYILPILCALIIAGFSIPQSAHAACGLVRLYPSAITTPIYDVFTTNEDVHSVLVYVLFSGSCNVFVTLDPGNSGDASQRILKRGPNELDYNVYTVPTPNAGNILKDIATASSTAEVIELTLATTSFLGVATFNLVWSVDPQQVVPSTNGNYRDNSISLRIYEGSFGGSYTLEDSRNVTFQTHVDPQIELSLVGDGDGFIVGDVSQTLDFTTGFGLTPFDNRSMDVVIRSNDGYILDFRSDNNEVMIHEDAPTETDVVGYDVTVNGGLVNLTSGTDVTVATAPNLTATPLTGDTIDVTVTIENFSNVMGGAYDDTINVTVSNN